MAKNDCVKKACRENQYWRQDLCRCVTHGSMDSLKHPPSGNDIMLKKAIQHGKDAIKSVGKMFGFKKGGATKMKMGSVKPKAMYGTSVKSSMMKKGGSKKK